MNKSLKNAQNVRKTLSFVFKATCNGPRNGTSCVISLGIAECSWSLSFRIIALLIYSWPGKSAETGIKCVLRYSWTSEILNYIILQLENKNINKLTNC